jgi:DNA-binding transcriptional LysR family regulator
MDTIDGLKTVVAVVETGSFTAAGEKLSISKGLVSKYIHEVEKQLDIRLFNRNTRKISLTDAGTHYYNHALKLLDNYSKMIEDVVNEQSSPKGLLRVSAPIAFGEHIVTPLIHEFSCQHPDISVDFVLNNRPVDMLKEGIDVRIKSGQVIDSNMVARPLCKWPLIICASPDYIDLHGLPLEPDDLSNHHCVTDSNLKSRNNWTLLSVTGEQITVPVHSRLSSNNPQTVVDFVKAGAGIGLVTKASVQKELQSGELIELFPDYTALTLDIYLIYPHKKYIPQKVQCFIDFMLGKFS